jgi:hypothetical protein
MVKLAHSPHTSIYARIRVQFEYTYGSKKQVQKENTCTMASREKARKIDR